MRLTERDKRTVHIKAQTNSKDVRGAVAVSYSGTYETIKAIVQPLSSKRASALTTEMHGQKTNEMLLMLYDGEEQINVADGVCVYVGSDAVPDYKIVSKERWSAHYKFELEKVI